MASMELNRYSESFQQLHQKHQEYIKVADKRVITVLNKMLKYALEIEDPTLVGYVYHSLAFAEHFIMGRYSRFIKYLNQATNYLFRSEDESQLMHVYYLIAIDAMNKGMFDISHYYYTEAHTIAERTGQDSSAAILDLSIASLLMRIGYYEDSKIYSKRSIKGIKKDKNHPHYYSNLLSGYMIDSILSIETGDLDQARKSLEIVERFINKYSEKLRSGTRLNFYLILLRLNLLEGKVKHFNADMDSLMEEIHGTANIYSFMDDVSKLCKLLIKKKKYPWVSSIIEEIDKEGIPTDTTEPLRLFAEVKVDYYKLKGNREELEAAYVAQGQVLDLQLQKRKDVYRHVTDLARLTGVIKKTRSKALDEKAKYLQIAKVDELTKIPNRYGATTYLDGAFERAYREGTRLGVVYADLDDLKFINDTRGHLAGDACLIEMGRTLAKHMDRGEFFAARYGGDEFIIVYENATTKEIVDSITTLKKEGTVNFSFGIHNDIPKGKQKSWQYLDLADKALYEDKKKK